MGGYVDSVVSILPNKTILFIKTIKVIQLNSTDNSHIPNKAHANVINANKFTIITYTTSAFILHNSFRTHGYFSSLQSPSWY